MAVNCHKPRTASRYGILYVITHEALYAEFHMITHKMATDWRKLKPRKEQRSKGASREEIKIESGEIVVQRLSAEVTGKAHEFSRIGPREFEYNEVTIENLKRACERHFEAKIGWGLVCDILAGEQGPSCKTVEQIPNVKMIHVRFISRKDVDIIESDGDYSTSLMSMGETHSKKRLTSAVICFSNAKAH